MVDRCVIKAENLKKSFTCNIEDKEKERRSIWRKNHTGMCGRVWFEPRRGIDQFKEVRRS